MNVQDAIEKSMVGKVVKDFRETDTGGYIIEFEDGWLIRFETYEKVPIEYDYGTLESVSRSLD